MFEVKVINITTNKIFIREFKDRKTALNFVRKVNYSKVLTLLSITDNSYLYD